MHELRFAIDSLEELEVRVDHALEAFADFVVESEASDLASVYGEAGGYSVGHDDHGVKHSIVIRTV